MQPLAISANSAFAVREAHEANFVRAATSVSPCVGIERIMPSPGVPRDIIRHVNRVSGRRF
jgi:hypothetical protein